MDGGYSGRVPLELNLLAMYFNKNSGPIFVDGLMFIRFVKTRANIL